MQVALAPADLINDLKASKNFMERYYSCKIKEWNKNDLRPTCDVISSIGEAGDLRSETIRLLHQFDIHTDGYEAELAECGSKKLAETSTFE
jgi:exoribonuclease R